MLLSHSAVSVQSDDIDLICFGGETTIWILNKSRFLKNKTIVMWHIWFAFFTEGSHVVNFSILFYLKYTKSIKRKFAFFSQLLRHASILNANLFSSLSLWSGATSDNLGTTLWPSYWERGGAAGRNTFLLSSCSASSIMELVPNRYKVKVPLIILQQTKMEQSPLIFKTEGEFKLYGYFFFFKFSSGLSPSICCPLSVLRNFYLTAVPFLRYPHCFFLFICSLCPS